MFKNIKNHFVKNLSKSTNISYSDFLIRRGILSIFILALFLFLKPYSEEYPNTLEVHQATGGYHPETILKEITIPEDWEYIWLPEKLPKGYVVSSPIEMGTKTDVKGNVLTIITMEFSRLIPDSKDSDTSSDKFKFVLPGTKEGKYNPRFSYNERYTFSKPSVFDENTTIESNPNARWKTEHLEFTQYKGLPTDLYSNYINSAVKYKANTIYFSKKEDQNILFWFQDGYTLCLMSNMNQDKLKQLANVIVKSRSILV